MKNTPLILLSLVLSIPAVCAAELVDRGQVSSKPSQVSLSSGASISHGGRKAPMVLEAGAEEVVNLDAQDAPRSIEWDQWRNHILHAAWANWGQRLDGGVNLGLLKINCGGKHPREPFANGTQASFQFTVTKEQRITGFRITESSGNAEFDDMVAKSVLSLDGKPMLAFPKGSERQTVIQRCTFRIGSKTEFRQHNFGDVEQSSASG